MSKDNLNYQVALGSQLEIGDTGQRITNNWQSSVSLSNIDRITLHFDQLMAALITYLERYSNNRQLVVVGCMAWFTHTGLITAFTKYCCCTLLLINKETRTMGNYRSLPGPGQTYSLKELFGHLEGPLGQFDVRGYGAVRTLGNPSFGSRKRKRTTKKHNAILHSKYLVLFDKDRKPAAVWNGSMNATHKSERNKETAIFIEDPRVALQFFGDFSLLFLQSEAIV